MANVQENWASFSLPKQYESRETDLFFEGEFNAGRLEGTTTADDGSEMSWVGVRAPELTVITPKWGEPINLIGANLDNWVPRSPDWMCHWLVKDGVLTNTAVGSDLVTKDEYFDFKLVAEYRYPLGSNSGIYLRGRYEFQIVDDHDCGKSGVGNSGAIYGFLAPTHNAVRPANEWNHAEITFLGRYVTVVLNGETVIDNAEIPGITGGALDSREWEPGPIFLQGDHGPVEFRTLTLTPSE
jgi:hypothetical protein